MVDLGGLRDLGASRHGRRVSEPTYFKREVGVVESAIAAFGTETRIPAPTSPAAKRGLRYERAVLKHLDASALPGYWISGLPFVYTSKGRSARAIPDALWFSADYSTCLIIEVKYRHLADAFKQLAFYRKIIAKAWPGIELSTLEVCRWYDPHIKLPKPVEFVKSFSEAASLRSCVHPLYVTDDKGR